jgi:hypothetical protein
MTKDVTQLRILRGGTYPELSLLTLTAIICIILREAGKE